MGEPRRQREVIIYILHSLFESFTDVAYNSRLRSSSNRLWNAYTWAVERHLLVPGGESDLLLCLTRTKYLLLSAQLVRASPIVRFSSFVNGAVIFIPWPAAFHRQDPAHTGLPSELSLVKHLSAISSQVCLSRLIQGLTSWGLGNRSIFL